MVAGALVTSFLLPVLAFAEESTTTTTTPAARDGKMICSNIESMRTKALGRLTTRVTEIQGKKGDHKTKFEAGRIERHDKLAAFRTTADSTRQERYTKLMAYASTTDQKSAVTTFQTEVERLVTIRKAAIDVAIKTFEDAVFALQTENEAKVTVFGTTIQSDITKIFDDAAASCTAQKTGPEVLAQIKAAMDAKRAARDIDKAAHVPGEQFKALQATRKASVEAAKTAFKAGLDAARVTLEASLNRKTS